MIVDKGCPSCNPTMMARVANRPRFPLMPAFVIVLPNGKLDVFDVGTVKRDGEVVPGVLELVPGPGGYALRATDGVSGVAPCECGADDQYTRHLDVDDGFTFEEPEPADVRAF